MWKDVKIWLLVKRETDWEMLSVKTFKRPRVPPPPPPRIDENPIPSDLSNNDLSNNDLLEPISVSLNLP